MNEDLFTTTVVAANAQPEVTSTIIPFNFYGNEVRVMKDNTGEPWFVAKDVCNILGYTNPSKAIFDHVDIEDKLNNESLSTLGQRGGWLINESGCYSLILRSNMPEAKKFKRWVTSEVLPSIRKHGGYIHATPDMSDEEIMARGIMIANATIERQKMRIAEQEKQLQLQAPAVEYCNDVLSASNLHTVNSIAVHLGVSAVRLNKFLVDNGYIYKQGDIYYPSCKIRDKGYCDFHVVPYINRQGEKMTREHLKWTEAGRKFVIEQFNKKCA